MAESVPNPTQPTPEPKQKTYAEYIKEVGEKYADPTIKVVRAVDRRICWVERDKFEGCGNEYANSGSSKGIGSMLQHCDGHVESMYKKCPKAWVDHFVRGYISTKYGKTQKAATQSMRSAKD